MKAQALLVVCLLGLASARKPVELNFGDTTYQNKVVLAMLEAERNMKSQAKSYADDKVCYGRFGCYNKLPIGALPESPDTIKPEFRLYTDVSNTPVHVYKHDLVVGKESDAAKKALKDKSKPLVFIAHGFGGNGDLDWLQKIRETKTDDHNANVIVVDWKQGARLATLYVRAAANTPLVGNIAAQLCKELIDKYGVPVEKVQFVGFSLGGQMAGFFAKYVNELTGKKIAKVSALDAAAPLFEANGIYPRKEHTHFLEAVHTSSGNLLWRGKVGLSLNYGHVDYFPNGGVDQPGCSFPNVSCAHNRAVQYYFEALANSEDCVYQGYPCDSVQDAQKGKCKAQKDLQHFLSMKKAVANSAILYFKTSNKAPYCLKE